MKWRWLAAYIAVGLVALLRVAATHRVFSAVIDEPVHIVAGQEWWLGEVAFDPSLEKLLSARGWLAVSETVLALDPGARRGGYKWLDAFPWERVGRSIRIYRVP